MINSTSRPLNTLEGLLEHITYFNPENHYTVARIKTSLAPNAVTVVGVLSAVHPGETLKITGAWEIHPRYGEQFRAASYTVVLPDTAAAIGTYLASGIIKGIGPSMARRLVEHFGSETLETIEQHPEKLLAVPGIGKVKASIIASSWREHHRSRELMRFLHEVGLKTAFCAKIIKAYGWDAVSSITKNPYRLAGDIPGIGFHTADAIAQKLGKTDIEPERSQACVRYLMQQSVKDGHMFVYEDQLLDRSETLFRINKNLITAAVKAMVDSQELVVEADLQGKDNRAVYFTKLHQAETGLADRLKALMSVPVQPVEIDAEKILASVQKKLAVKLSSEQLDALQQILSSRTVVITGGPGTGKTTLIRSVNAVLEALAKRVLLAAPTGRAARRLSEVTRREAKTIHKLLGYNFETGLFDKYQDNPLEADALIVDEASMVDTQLMYHLIRALPMTAHLVLVGDVFQLPPVGPGNVLSDIIHSSKMPVFYLSKIFRQAQESPIIVNAHRIRQGKEPILRYLNDTGGLSEFYFLEQKEPQKVAAAIVELCSQTLPQRFSLDPVSETQVLSPMHKGVAGTINLNQALQGVLNPGSVGIEIMGSRFGFGDKVMHLKNNYQKEVFNGDIGIICAIDHKNRHLSVNYEGRTVPYDINELDELSLAYAISVHKSQGSEYPAVIVPIMTQHFALLQRNLLYTAITRGKKLVILVGTKKALHIALKNDKPRNRLSKLSDRLSQ